MTLQKKFCLIFAVGFIAALLIGIANKIKVGLWLWPNILPDAALIIYSLIAASAFTMFMFGILVEWPKGKKWLILAISILIFSTGLSLVTKVWPAENAAQNIHFQKTLCKR